MSRMILAIFTFLSIALSNPVISQPFFIVDNFDTMLSRIGLLDPNDNCSITDIVNVSGELGFDIQGMTFAPNGDFYGVDLQDNLYKIDLTDGSYSLIGKFPVRTFSIRSSPDGIIYGVADTLSSYDLNAGTFAVLGKIDFPNPPPPSAFGSLTFRQGKLYGVYGGTVGVTEYFLVAINIENPAESEILMELIPDFGGFSGLATINNDCDSSVTYAVQKKFFGGANIFEIDFDNLTQTFICEDITALNMEDAAHPSEQQTFTCTPEIDLDEDDSSGAVGNDYRPDTLCFAERIHFLAPTDVRFLNELSIDSLWVGFAAAPPDGVSESVDCDENASVSCSSEGNGIIVHNNGGLDGAALEEWLSQSVFYENTAALPTPGLRLLAVVVWHRDYASDTAFVFLPLVEGLSAGEDGMLRLCADDAAINLSEFLNGNPAAGGSWLPETTSGNGLFDPLQDVPGDYEYIVSNAFCPSDTAVISVAVDALPVFSLGSDFALCPGASATLQAGVGAASYLWQDGSDSSELTISSAGLYWLEITAATGCQWRDSVEVIAADTVLVEAAMALCEGDVFDLEGIPITSDTSFCVLETSATGCDSTYCLTVRFLPLPTLQIAGDSGICEGGEAQLFVTGTFNTLLWSTGESSSEIVVENAGSYSVTVTGEGACEVEGIWEVLPQGGPEAVVSQQAPSCPEVADGLIRIDSVFGGTSPYLASIDGGAFSETFVFENLAAGNHFAVLEDSRGCRYEMEIALEEAEALSLNLGEDQEINFGDSIRIEAMTDALDIESILWSPPDYLNRTDSLVVIAAPPEEIVYSALLTTQAGCTASDDITLFVRREEKIFIPNAFTPNGDSVNDSFRVFFGDGITAIGSIKIFNRWGDLVFDQSGDVAWDGKFRGKAAQMGVYVYLVRVQLSDGTERSFSGDVTLLR